MITLLKLMGIALIMTSCIGTGITKAAACRLRISALEDTKALFVTLKQRLSFTLAPPKELFEEIFNSKRFIHCRYLTDVLSDIDKLGFDEAWNKALNRNEQAFNQEDIFLLNQLTSIIGKSDLMTQQQQMEQLLQQLDWHIANARNRSEDKQRMYISLGTLGGFTAAIILI